MAAWCPPLVTVLTANGNGDQKRGQTTYLGRLCQRGRSSTMSGTEYPRRTPASPLDQWYSVASYIHSRSRFRCASLAGGSHVRSDYTPIRGQDAVHRLEAQ